MSDSYIPQNQNTAINVTCFPTTAQPEQMPLPSPAPTTTTATVDFLPHPVSIPLISGPGPVAPGLDIAYK